MLFRSHAVAEECTGFGNGTLVAPGAFLSYGMLNQVADFQRMVAHQEIAFDPASTLFFIAGGLNDGSVPTATTLANITSQFQTLYGTGGRNFQLALLPTMIPAFSAVGTRLNPAYQSLLPQLQTMFPDAKISLSNWGPDFDQVITHPATYGLTNTTDQCAGREIFGEYGAPCATPSTYFYYHGAHPSTAVHNIVGDMLYQDILTAAVPEPGTDAMMLAGVGLLALAMRRKRLAG